MEQGLSRVRVLDFTTQVAGPYATKLLADGGADVVKVEPRGGDPLRRWSATGAELGGEDSALFRYLNAGKRAIVGAASHDRVRELIATADLVVEAWGLAWDAGERLDVDALRTLHPRLVILSITPWGRSGPWSDRPASEFTIQAESGSIGMRGLPGQEPFQAGGRICEWLAGTFASVAALAAVRGARMTGRGEHVDFAMLELAHIAASNYADLTFRLMSGGAENVEPPCSSPQGVETPSIEPTRDGYVGFCTNTRQQFSDFLLMIGRPDLRDDEELAQIAGRSARFEEWSAIVQAFTRNKTTVELIEAASLLRIPVAPICNGSTVADHPQLATRGVFVREASGGFLQPRRPYRIDDVDPPVPRPAPRLERVPAAERFETAPASRGEDSCAAGQLPLEGLRVLDMTAWWAGPSATHMLACLGAEVIHVESITRPDGMRMTGGMAAAHFADWWEASQIFLAVNCNKKGITVDLDQPAGRALIERLVPECDAVFENFTPRVFDGFGLTWDRIHELNRRCIFVRMPAFGLTGPWRDNTGFAQTMEQLSGLAWITGHRDDQPRIQRGPCDPLAGMHAAMALLVALEERDATGRGHFVECTMVEGALNVAAEQLIEWTAYGRLMERDGNRSPLAAPQGLYSCAGDAPGLERWLALSVVGDAQWLALRRLLEEPSWARDLRFDTLAGRRANHDVIDGHLREWTTRFEREVLVERLLDAGIPAAPVADPRTLSITNPQLRTRRFFEGRAHSVVGSIPVPGLPFRFSGVDSWIRTAAPTLGQHTRDVLSGLLGLSAADLDELERDKVIGTRPEGLP